MTMWVRIFSPLKLKLLFCVVNCFVFVFIFSGVEKDEGFYCYFFLYFISG